MSDGALSVTGSKAMTGTPVNDPPTATNLSTAETYVEDTTLNLVNIVASDIDSATVTATLTLSNTAAGSLTTGTSGAVTSTYVAGTGAWTASGAIADVNTLLAGVSFVPALNFNANFTIATSVSDGALSVTGSKAMTGTPVNDPPTATNLSAAETYVEDTTLNLVNIVASDIDSATVTATLTLSNTAAGSLTTGTSGAVTSTYVAGTGTWTASGAIADVNTLLAGVSFVPALNFNANFTIATSVSDGALSVTGSKAMTGTPVNDPPTATNLSAAETYVEDTTLNLVNIVASDVDSATVTATLTLSNTAAGSLTTGTSGAVTSTYVAGHRHLDRVGRDRRRQHPPGRRQLRPGPQLQRQLHDRDQRVRRRPVGHRLQGHDRHPGQRRPSGRDQRRLQPSRRGNVADVHSTR